MATRGKRSCGYPGCSALIEFGQGRRCPKHRRQDRRQRDQVYERKREADPKLARAQKIRGSARWQRYRSWFKARWPLCCNPLGEPDHPGLTDDVHHVRGLAEHPEDAFRSRQCAPLCEQCHTRVEAMVRAGERTEHLFDNFRQEVETRDHV